MLHVLLKSACQLANSLNTFLTFQPSLLSSCFRDVFATINCNNRDVFAIITVPICYNNVSRDLFAVIT